MVSIKQVRAARALLGWSQEDLAAKSGISYATIARLEAAEGEIGRPNTTAKILAAFERAGVIFVAENGDGPGVRLRKRRN